jgi:hypothetical protein
LGHHIANYSNRAADLGSMISAVESIAACEPSPCRNKNRHQFSLPHIKFGIEIWNNE